MGMISRWRINKDTLAQFTILVKRGYRDALNHLWSNNLTILSLQAVISMFDNMGMISRWRINKGTLAQFIILVKRGYRDPPYHNWYHAFSVGHFCYQLYENINKLDMLE